MNLHVENRSAAGDDRTEENEKQKTKPTTGKRETVKREI
jgi:hypothetical protein